LVVLGKSVLKKLVDEYSVIEPCEESGFDGDGYVLTVKDDVTLNYLEHKNVISKEIVFTPPDFVAHLTSKSRFGRMGLCFLNSVKVHSGFVGRLALELVNLSNERKPITIKSGDPLIHIEFIRREGEPSPYSGRYMFQYMEESEVNRYISILQTKFPGIFDTKSLHETIGRRLIREEI
jgi:dCTP deaminase